jgi:hypothetical protein
VKYSRVKDGISMKPKAINLQKFQGKKKEEERVRRG